MTLSAAVLLSGRDRWLARRRELVTASDAAAILGADDHGRSAYAVWASKVGNVPCEETIEMARGRRYEAVIGEDYSLQTGRSIWPKEDPYEIAVHPDCPWLGATLDMLAGRDDRGEFELGPLQIKMAIGSARDWRDEPPTGYLVQVQIEIACARATWGALCALVGPGPLKTVDLERDDAFLALALPKLERFHWHVQNRTPPEADGSESTTAALKALYRIAENDTVELGPDGQADVTAWDEHEARAAGEQMKADAAKNRLRARIGSACFGRLPDGKYVEWKADKRGVRSLRRFSPGIRRRD